MPHIPDMKLFFAPGACSRVPMVLLEKIGCSFETELVAFMRGDHRSPEFLALNPSGKIPVLKVDDHAISQNPAIVLWLNDQHPQANLLPPTKDALARHQQLGQLLRFSSDLHPLVTRIRMPHFFCDMKDAPRRVAELAKTAMTTQLAGFEKTLAERDWLAGSNWGALDAYLHWVWFRITGAGFDTDAFPSISAHYQRTLQIAAFQRAIQREQTALKWLEENGLSVKLA